MTFMRCNFKVSSVPIHLNKEFQDLVHLFNSRIYFPIIQADKSKKNPGP